MKSNRYCLRAQTEHFTQLRKNNVNIRNGIVTINGIEIESNFTNKYYRPHECPS